MKDLSKVEKMSLQEVSQYIGQVKKEIEQNYYGVKKREINSNIVKRVRLNNSRVFAVANADAAGRCSKSISLVIRRKAIAAAKGSCFNFTFSVSALIGQ